MYLGTRAYMAPETLTEKPYSRQADLWSLGNAVVNEYYLIMNVVITL